MGGILFLCSITHRATSHSRRDLSNIAHCFVIIISIEKYYRICLVKMILAQIGLFKDY